MKYIAHRALFNGPDLEREYQIHFLEDLVYGFIVKT
jgi:hypothetical protein